MNKALLVMLAASVSLNVYLVNVDVVVRDDLDQEYIEQPKHDKITVAQAAIEKGPKAEIKKGDCEPKIIEKIVEKTVYLDSKGEPAVSPDFANGEKMLNHAEKSEIVQALSNEWSQKSKHFFDHALGLTDEQQTEFANLKVRMDEEIAKLLGKESLESANGRVVSSDEMVKMGQIQKKYIEKVRNLFGPGAYDEYVSFREKYNRKLAQEDKGFYRIHF